MVIACATTATGILAFHKPGCAYCVPPYPSGSMHLFCTPCPLLIVAGNLPVDLALSLAAVIMSLLYAPQAQALDSPMLQASLAQLKA